MRRTIAAVGLLGLGIMGTTLPAIAEPGNGQGNNVSICHETGSDTNPVVEIDVNENAVNGHGPGSNNGQGGGPGDNNGQGGGPGDNNGQGGGPGVNNGQGGGPGVNNGQGGHDDDECYQEPGGNEEPNVPPVVEPPAEEPPVDSPPVVAPPVVAPPVAAPPAVVPQAPAAPAVKPVAEPVTKPAAVPVAAAPAAAAAPVAAMPVAARASNAGYNVQTAAGGDAGTGIPSWLATLTGALAGLSGLVLLRGGMRARKLEG